jgi:hypothetical protein
LNSIDIPNGAKDRDVPDSSSDTFEGAQTDNNPEDIAWEQRVLCRDESCIGIIGPDGRCKECGIAYEAGHSEQDVAIDERFQDEEETAEEAPNDITPQIASADDDVAWENRVLCSDESCIGVVGPDGRCKECGKPYQEE